MLYPGEILERETVATKPSRATLSARASVQASWPQVELMSRPTATRTKRRVIVLALQAIGAVDFSILNHVPSTPNAKAQRAATGAEGGC
jgi:hypothetical protein